MSNEQMTERSEGAEVRISVFAEKAAHAFSYCGSEDALEWVQQNWHGSVKPYFDAFVADVRKTEVPLSPDYFSVDGIYTNLSNPIFTFLSPKMIHPLMEKLPMLSAEEWKVLDEKVFGPYFAAWERLMRALASRYRGTAAVVQFKATLRSSVNDLVRLVRYRAANPDAQWFMAYSERFDALCAAFEQIGVAIADAPTALPQSPEALPLRRRERYCFGTDALATMFRVNRRTILRWKSEDTDWGRTFRACKDSAADMEACARRFHADRGLARMYRNGGRVSYDDSVNYRNDGNTMNGGRPVNGDSDAE